MSDTLKLSRNIIFNDKKYFYDSFGAILLTANSIIAKNSTGGDVVAKWPIPNAPYIASNIEILSDSPFFGNLNDKKINFIHLFKTIPSLENKENLVRTMSSIINAMLLALQSADKLYWILKDDDPTKAIRSEFSLDYCLSQGAKLAQDQLRILNIIDEIYLPKSIISVKAEDAFNDMIINRKKQAGFDIANALNNDPEKTKKKRIYNKKSKK